MTPFELTRNKELHSRLQRHRASVCQPQVTNSQMVHAMNDKLQSRNVLHEAECNIDTNENVQIAQHNIHNNNNNYNNDDTTPCAARSSSRYVYYDEKINNNSNNNTTITNSTDNIVSNDNNSVTTTTTTSKGKVKKE